MLPCQDFSFNHDGLKMFEQERPGCISNYLLEQPLGLGALIVFYFYIYYIWKVFDIKNNIAIF